jgi:hypothetical protein
MSRLDALTRWSCLKLATAILLGISSTAAWCGPTVEVVAEGLHNPRGLKFGPDRALYVAEGGLGGTMTTDEKTCQQVLPPFGPYSGGFTSRVSRIDPVSGKRVTVVDQLPSSQSPPGLGNVPSGASDVAFIGGRLYVLLAGAGCSHGLADTANGVLRIGWNGQATLIADLGAFLKANPVAEPYEPDFEPDGTWYSMISVGGLLVAVEPNHGEIDVIVPRGRADAAVHRFVDVSAKLGHIVPTALAFHDGALYMGNLARSVPGSASVASVYRINEHGEISLVATGLSAVVGIAFHKGRLYALESYTGTFAPFPSAANSGTVVRLNDAGEWDTVVTGLNFPTAMTFGPDGNIYISNKGFSDRTNRAGQIVRVRLPRDGKEH